MVRRNFGVISMIWQVVWPILFYTAVTAVIAFFMGGFLNVMWVVTLAAVISSVFLFYVYGRREQERRRDYGPSWRVRIDMGRGAALVFILAFASCIFLNNLMELTGIVHMSEGFDEINEDIYSVSIVLQILSTGLAAPVVEELIFRGLCYGRLRSAMGIIPAAVVSALIFGLYHGNLVQAVYAFALGILLALVYEHFDGLFPAVWFHVSANLTSIILTASLGAFPAFFGSWIFILISTVLSFLAAAACLRVIYDRRRRIRK
ncbi:CPBP family intramembrane glutamic endopeptidase [uncultured Clostridium sp.]|uniref:CPBP family intramembrane glutamic endopeptidase n=1 Tax=uncultured Clostridium sp. TaxID=59620 RepID=UPI0025E54CAB|nr:type II CAAX endopeptidase family protein [uncultured Clostridium sp.]